MLKSAPIRAPSVTRSERRYAVGHRRTSRDGIWMAAVLACGDGSVISHGCSGQLLGLISRRGRIALHVSVPNRSYRSPPGIVVARPRSLDPRDSSHHRGIPTTTATRAVWDVSQSLPSLQARRGFEQAEKLHLLERPRLLQLSQASPRRKGATSPSLGRATWCDATATGRWATSRRWPPRCSPFLPRGSNRPAA